mmetsp:Transcript_39595/g.98002  ORF Transcript_39595/g.98002 Transcript_39595/m.98002 type:complete len:307 (+) Transcript_39595:3-923(+)
MPPTPPARALPAAYVPAERVHMELERAQEPQLQAGPGGHVGSEPSSSQASLSPLDRRMHQLNKECSLVGTLGWFRHFRLQLRGCEELLLTVRCGDSRASPGGRRARWPTAQDGSWGLPVVADDDAAAPASPSAREKLRVADDEAVFLVGGYFHYHRPYVWVRALGSGAKANDAPLKLHSTFAPRWSTENGTRQETHVWDIIAEIVGHYVLSRPDNPFEVELDALSALPVRDRLLASASMVHFLREVYLSQSGLHDLIEADYLALVKMHFLALSTVPLPSTQASVPAPVSDSRMPETVASLDMQWSF